MRGLVAVVLLVLTAASGQQPGQAAPRQDCAAPPGWHSTPSGMGFLLRRPPGANSRTPLMLSLHGATGSAFIQEQGTGFTELGQHSFITAYPQARGAPGQATWNASPGSSDEAFVADIVHFLHRHRCSSPGRTFISGFSLGAMLSARLICAHPDDYAGVAMVAGALPPLPRCRLHDRHRVLIVHGRLDDVVPYDGSLPAELQSLAGGAALSDFPGRSRASMARDWARAKDCASRPERINRQRLLIRCRPGPVMALIYRKGRHAWDPPDSAASTSRRIVRFFDLTRKVS